jgi:glycosyltransferase involved in cell wall biosynthesis
MEGARLVGHGLAAGGQVDLAAKLRVLIENEELRRRLADNAAALIRAEFSIESAARRMGDIYDEVLSCCMR